MECILVPYWASKGTNQWLTVEVLKCECFNEKTPRFRVFRPRQVHLNKLQTMPQVVSELVVFVGNLIHLSCLFGKRDTPTIVIVCVGLNVGVVKKKHASSKWNSLQSKHQKIKKKQTNTKKRQHFLFKQFHLQLRTTFYLQLTTSQIHASYGAILSMGLWVVDPKTTSQRFVPLLATKVNDDLGDWRFDHGNQGKVIMEKVGKPTNNKKYVTKRTWVELQRETNLKQQNGVFFLHLKTWVHWKGSICFQQTCTNTCDFRMVISTPSIFLKTNS